MKKSTQAVLGLSRSHARIGAVSPCGDAAPARPLLEEALALSRTAESGPGVGIPLFQLGILALVEGNLAQAAAVLNDGLVALRARGDVYRVSHLLFILGFAELGLGQVAAARVHFDESLAIATARHDSWALALILEGFGCLAAARGRFRDLDVQTVVRRVLELEIHLAFDLDRFK